MFLFQLGCQLSVKIKLNVVNGVFDKKLFERTILIAYRDWRYKMIVKSFWKSTYIL
jgi:hypothetical protein